MPQVHQIDASRSAILQEPQANYRVSMTLAVHDVEDLWAAAASKGLEDPDLCLDDIIAVIGSADDPSINDCIMMLAAPKAWPGCKLDDFWIDSVAITPLRLVRPA